jgi:hypothetical protein
MTGEGLILDDHLRYLGDTIILLRKDMHELERHMMEHGQLLGLRAHAFVHNIYQGFFSQHLSSSLYAIGRLYYRLPGQKALGDCR